MTKSFLKSILLSTRIVGIALIGASSFLFGAGIPLLLLSGAPAKHLGIGLVWCGLMTTCLTVGVGRITRAIDASADAAHV